MRPSDGHIFRFSIDTRLAGLFGDFLDLAQADGRYELRTPKELTATGLAQGGTSSFMCRAIKGSNPPVPSNHSSATAIDLWTRANPMVRGGRFVSTIHPEVVELAAAALIYWGGWYYDTDGTYVDAMHFEFMATPEDVAGARTALAAKADEIRHRHDPPPLAIADPPPATADPPPPGTADPSLATADPPPPTAPREVVATTPAGTSAAQSSTKKAKKTKKNKKRKKNKKS